MSDNNSVLRLTELLEEWRSADSCRRGFKAQTVTDLDGRTRLRLELIRDNHGIASILEAPFTTDDIVKSFGIAEAAWSAEDANYAAARQNARQ